MHWLALGALLSVFSTAGGHWPVAAAAWLAPVFLVRFARTREAGVAVLWVTPALTLASAVALWGVVPMPASALVAMAAVGAVFATGLLALDRLVSRRRPGLAATVVLPSASVVLDWLSAQGGFGTWGNTAYTQVELAPMMQLASVTGIWGIGFLVQWAGPLVNTAWEAEGEGRWRVLRIPGMVLTVVLLWGGLRLALAPDLGPAVRVATVGLGGDVGPLRELAGARMQGSPLAEQDAIAAHTLEQLLQATRAEAAAGAELVVWEEGAVIVSGDAQPHIERAQKVAREAETALVIALVRDGPQAPQKVDNHVVLIDSSGSIAGEYSKSLLVPGPESEGTEPGDGVVPVVELAGLRVAPVICFEADFPQQVAQAAGAELVLSPSWDWPEIDPQHSQQVAVRAVEQGVSLVRATRDGRSLAVDPYGRTLAAMGHHAADQRGLVAWVPRRGPATLYSWLGDGFVGLSALGFVVAMAGALRRPRGG